VEDRLQNEGRIVWVNGYAFQTDLCSEYFHASDNAIATSFYGKILGSFFDDILITSKSREQYLDHLRLY